MGKKAGPELGGVTLPSDAVIQPPLTPADKVEDDWGCDHCRNDGPLTSAGTCPVCDAEFFEGDSE